MCGSFSVNVSGQFGAGIGMWLAHRWVSEGEEDTGRTCSFLAYMNSSDSFMLSMASALFPPLIPLSTTLMHEWLLTSLGIVEDLTDIRDDFLQRLIFFILQLVVDSVERHGMLDEFIVVGELALVVSTATSDEV
jgi:hypothetical protein